MMESGSGNIGRSLDHFYAHKAQNITQNSSNSANICQNEVLMTATTTNTAKPAMKKAINSPLDHQALMKENKQLKSMLLLHLDLIQEQSDMLLARDKQVAALKQENEVLKLKAERLERRIHSRVGSPRDQDENIDINSIPSINLPNKNNATLSQTVNPLKQSVLSQSTATTLLPVTKPIQRTTNLNPKNNTTNNFKVVINNNFNNKTSPNERDEKSNGFLAKPKLFRSEFEDQKPSLLPCGSIQDESSVISNKIVLQKADSSTSSFLDTPQPNLDTSFRLKIDEDSDDQTQSDSNHSSSTSMSLLKPIEYEEKIEEDDLKLDFFAKNSPILETPPPETISIENVAIKTEKLEEKDLFSCEKEVLEQPYSSPPKKRSISETSSKGRKYLKMMTTNEMYIARYWEQVEEEEEPIPEPKKELSSIPEEEVNLEIPCWKEIEDDLIESPSTEELQNFDDDPETYLKRHSKYEADEKRRKKWDVQRIREQKNIERLKKRHCKFDALNIPGSSKTGAEDTVQTLFSLFPSPSQIKFVEITSDLPVQAFGEAVPNLTPLEFQVPWWSARDPTGSSSNSVEMATGDEARTSSFTLKTNATKKVVKLKRIKPIPRR